MKEEEAPEEALEVQFKFGHEEGKDHQTIIPSERKISTLRPIQTF